MSESHEYIKLDKPAALSTEEFAAALDALVTFWGTRPDGLPHERLHWAFSQDGNSVIMDGVVETDNMTPAATATHLVTVVGGSAASLLGALNRAGALIRFRPGQNDKRASRDEAAAYIDQNKAVWGRDSVEAVVSVKGKQ